MTCRIGEVSHRGTRSTVPPLGPLREAIEGTSRGVWPRYSTWTRGQRCPGIHQSTSKSTTATKILRWAAPLEVALVYRASIVVRVRGATAVRAPSVVLQRLDEEGE